MIKQTVVNAHIDHTYRGWVVTMEMCRKNGKQVSDYLVERYKCGACKELIEWIKRQTRNKGSVKLTTIVNGRSVHVSVVQGWAACAPEREGS